MESNAPNRNAVLKEVARTLFQAGASVKEVAWTLGLDEEVAQRWLSPYRKEFKPPETPDT